MLLVWWYSISEAKIKNSYGHWISILMIQPRAFYTLFSSDCIFCSHFHLLHERTDPKPLCFAGKEPCAAEEIATAVTSYEGWQSQADPVLWPSLFPWVWGSLAKSWFSVCVPPLPRLALCSEGSHPPLPTYIYVHIHQLTYLNGCLANLQ